MKEINEVTRAEFIEAIRSFKKQYPCKKLKELINEKTSPESANVFWSNHIIHGYLARPFISFVDKHPELYNSKIKAEHDQSDHYELKIYQALPDKVAYRNKSILSSAFFEKGTVIQTCNNLIAILQSFCEDSSDIEIKPSKDIYQITADIGTRNLISNKKSCFTISILS